MGLGVGRSVGSAVGGLVGSGLSVVVLPDYVSAGASGGAWGLMIALFLLLQFPFMRQGTRIRGAPVGPLLQLIGLNAVFSLLPGVNGLAHFGGGVGGVRWAAIDPFCKLLILVG